MVLSPSRQLPLDLKFAPAMGREDFMVGDCNRAAVGLVENWPKDWKPYPFLTLYGPKGCGKTHLAAVWQHKSGAEILSLKDFGTADVESLIAAKKNIVLDHLEFLIGDKEQEEKLFHLHNAFRQQDNYILGLSTTAPEKLVFEIKDMESRLRAAGSAEIRPPDDELLTRVLAKRFADQNLTIDQDGLDYILNRMERSWDGLDALVEKIRLTATALKKGDLTKPVLRAAMLEEE
ncbi:MAG TPA: DnaA/Hda family protein [Alphaproteobacteria bacterium]|nr:DnaA/Hda family protein [Alphaproteobacteria bacterium]